MALHVDRSHRLPESEYFAEPQANSGIALHHTVCNSTRITLDIWRRDRAADGTPSRVATASFPIDHPNAESWRKRKNRLLAVDSLRLAVATLRDSVLRLETANADAYRGGYEVAYAGYQDLSGRYVAELRQPRFRLPSPFGMLAAAAVGLRAGRVLP